MRKSTWLMRLMGLSIIAFAFAMVPYSEAAFTMVEGDQQFNGVVNWFPLGVKIGKTDGTGGVTYFNGTIVNENTDTNGGDTPVTFGDNVRIDGRAFRGDKQGPQAISGNTFPFIIDDDFEVTGNVNFAGNSTVDFNNAQVEGLDISHLLSSDDGDNKDLSVYTKTEVDNFLNDKSDTIHIHDERYYTETEINNFLSGKSDTTHTHSGTYIEQSNPSWNAVTTHYSISPIDFIALDLTFLSRDDTEFSTAAGFAGTTDFFSSVHLPQGATVTGLSMNYEDSSPNNNFSLILRRNDKDGTSSPMVSLSSSGSSGTNTVVSSSSITGPVVDNDSYTYALVLDLPAFDAGSQSFTGGYIEYTIDAFN